MLRHSIQHIRQVTLTAHNSKAAEKAEKLRVAAKAIQQEAAEVVDEADFRKWLPEQTNIAAIITDPPYPEEFLPLYSDLAKAAKPHVEAGAILAALRLQLVGVDAVEFWLLLRYLLDLVHLAQSGGTEAG